MVATLLYDYFFLGLVVLLLALRSSIGPGLGRRRDQRAAGPLLRIPVAIVICVLFVEATNISIIKADIFTSRDSSLRRPRWDYAASLYEKKRSSLRYEELHMTSSWVGRSWSGPNNRRMSERDALSLSRRGWSKPSG